ncbi:nucleotidyltransferase family protein [uncultured Nocardioides sp.]|uniref:nucleotidyltransferase family protein n=1 Tax=uncultured Nocardioides sp. TaxID=198441 RepID=UPI003454058A
MGNSPEQVLAVVQDALRRALASQHGSPWTLAPGISERAFAQAVQRQRVTSQLVTRLGDTLPAEVRAHHAALTTASDGTARDLHQVLELFTAAGVRVLVFKGMALAAQAWGDETARGFGDLDLLVSPPDLERAHHVLREAGWRTSNVYPTPGPSWGWRQFCRSECEMTFQRGRTDIDLHWHALPARGAFPEFEELWARRENVNIRGRRVPTFGFFDALAHSASHSAKDHWRWLRGIADVHRLMSDPRTWAAADRPLRGDQLLTLGVAAQLLGIPDGSPRVVIDAARACQRVLPRVQIVQLMPERSSAQDWVPGRGTLETMTPLWHARVRPQEFVRRLSSSAMPPWALAEETSVHAYTAAPRVLLLRASEVGRRIRQRGLRLL